MSAAEALYTNLNDELTLVADDKLGVPLEATRYIFTPGDYLDPARKDQLAHLKRGGDELLSNPCLRRTTNRFLPKCAITPLEFWGEELAWDLFPKEGISVRAPVKLRGVEKRESAPNSRIFPELFFYPHYPGELIRDALDAGHEPRGIVEISQLRAVPWESGEAQAAQETFFPSNWIVPVQLRLVEEQIGRTADKNGSDIKDMASEMLTACEQFRRYAMNIIGRENTQIAQRVMHQHVYSYSPKCRMLAEQLEVKLAASTQDTIGTEIAKVLASLPSAQPVDPTVIAAAVAEAVKQALASKPAPAEVVEKAVSQPRSKAGQFTKKVN